MSSIAITKKLKTFEAPLQDTLSKWLYLHLPPQPITSKKMHRAYAAAVSVLLRERQMGILLPKAHKAVAKYLSAVVPFIDDYEKGEQRASMIGPEDMLVFLMEQNNLTQQDLAKDLGGQSTVSNVLKGRRKLTREHIERLSKRFGISPATFYASVV